MNRTKTRSKKMEEFVKELRTKMAVKTFDDNLKNVVVHTEAPAQVAMPHGAPVAAVPAVPAAGGVKKVQ